MDNNKGDRSMTKDFGGFEKPKENWSKLPHQFIYELPNFSNLAGLKIVLYVLRHTWGYGDPYKKISIDEFMNGRKHRDGSRIDRGTGLSKPSVVSGCKWAVDNGYLFEVKDKGDGARIKKYYSLTELGLKSLTSDVKDFNPRGKDYLPRTEKETEEKETEENAAAVFIAYENNIGQLSPILSEKIGEAIDEFPHQWLLDAIQEAATHNGRSWAYIEKILKRWQAEGRGSRKKPSDTPNPNGNSDLPSWLPAHEDLPAPSWEF